MFCCMRNDIYAHTDKFYLIKLGKQNNLKSVYSFVKMLILCLAHVCLFFAAYGGLMSHNIIFYG